MVYKRPFFLVKDLLKLVLKNGILKNVLPSFKTLGH